MHSSFPVICNVGNVGISLLFKYENKLHEVITSIIFQSTMANADLHRNLFSL